MVTAKPFRPDPAPSHNQDSLTEILRPFEPQVFQKGESILPQWQRETDVFFVVKGKVLLHELDEASGRELVTGIFTDGDCINPEILVGEVTPGRHAVAKSEVVAKAVPIISLLNLMAKTPFLSRYLLRSVVLRQKELQDRLHRLALLSTRQRILHFLVDYVEKVGSAAGYEKVVRNVLTHQELAGLCNASRQSVTTLLNELRHLRLIHFNRRYLLVRDFDQLKKMAMTDPAT